MNDLVVQIVSGALLFLLGVGVTTWRQRARPLVILQGFAGILSRREDAKPPAELADLTRRTAHTEIIPADSAEVGDIADVETAARLTVLRYEHGLDRLKVIEHRLADPSDRADVVDTIKDMVANTGIHDALDMALKWEHLKIPPVPDEEQLSDPLPIAESDREDGSYTLVWKTSTSQFSANLNRAPFLRPRVIPFLDILRHLHAPSIMSLIPTLRQFMEDQVTTCRKIIEHAEPLVSAKQRWAAKVLVANYGGNPMVLWPEATLEVKHPSSRSRYKTACYVAVEFGESPRVRDLDGLLVLAPGERRTLWIITSDVQERIPNGSLMRTIYEQDDGTARVTLKITRRGAIIGPRVRSTKAMFAKTTSLPTD